jgi:hypothetical protein
MSEQPELRDTGSIDTALCRGKSGEGRGRWLDGAASIKSSSAWNSAVKRGAGISSGD